MSLEVSVYETVADTDPLTLEVDFVSFVDANTHGRPPLIAPSDKGAGAARPGQTVLYINTSLVPMWEITRRDA